MKRDPPLEYLKPDELELWQEANVRNNDPMQNLDELSRNIRRNGLRVPLLARGKTQGANTASLAARGGCLRASRRGSESSRALSSTG